MPLEYFFKFQRYIKHHSMQFKTDAKLCTIKFHNQNLPSFEISQTQARLMVRKMFTTLGVHRHPPMRYLRPHREYEKCVLISMCHRKLGNWNPILRLLGVDGGGLGRWKRVNLQLARETTPSFPASPAGIEPGDFHSLFALFLGVASRC